MNIEKINHVIEQLDNQDLGFGELGMDYHSILLLIKGIVETLNEELIRPTKFIGQSDLIKWLLDLIDMRFPEPEEII